MEKQNIVPIETGKKQASEGPHKFDRLKDAEAQPSFDFSKEKKV